MRSRVAAEAHSDKEALSIVREYVKVTVLSRFRKPLVTR